MTRQQGTSRMWVPLSLLLFSTSLSCFPGAQAHAPLEIKPPPHALPTRPLARPAAALAEKTEIAEIPIPTTDEEFKQLRDSILQGATDCHSVVDELLMERRSAAEAVV